MNSLPTALPLTPDACPDAPQRRMAIEFSADSIEVLVPAAIEYGEPMHALIPLNRDISDPVKAVEETIYANPLLLADFTSVTVLLRNFTVLPQPAGFGPWLPPGDGFETMCENHKALRIDLMSSHRSELLKFLRRSFNNPRMFSHLSPLLDWSARHSRRLNHSRMYVQWRNSALDLLAFSHEQLMMAASYPAPTVDDALYFTLAACETCRFERTDGEMLLVAPRHLRDELQPRLRRYVNYVMPLLTPADIYRDASLELALASRHKPLVIN